MKIRVRNRIAMLEEVASMTGRAAAADETRFDFLPLPVLTLDQNGLIRDCNSAALRLFGRERFHLQRLPFAALVKQEDLPLIFHHLHRAKETPESTVDSELRVRVSGNRLVYMQVISRAVPDADGISLQTALVDLTERHTREKQNEEARQYTELFEFVPEPLLVLDLALHVITTNAALRDRLRCSRDEVDGLALDQLEFVRWGSPELLARLKAVAAGGPPLQNFPCEVVLVGLAHHLHFLVSARKPARVEGKRPVLLAAMRDVTLQHATEQERERLLNDLRRLNAQLERHVDERTAELRAANRELSALSRRLVDSQEAERRRIAETLHDDIGQMLTALKLVLRRASGAHTVAELAKAEKLTDDLLERVRCLSTNLRPHILDNLGLAAALRWHAKKFSQHTNVRVLLRTSGVGRDVDAAVATTIFRVVQEALTNVARHSGATVARVSVARRRQGLSVEVTDNGCGFKLSNIPESSSGLSSLRERVRLSGGEFSVESRMGKGTAVRASVPVENPAQPAGSH